MDHDRYDDGLIGTILNRVKTIAVVGASTRTSRPSYFVVRYLQSKGYEVIPVNPGQAGRKIGDSVVQTSLAAIDRPIDMVEIFRSPDKVGDMVEAALALEPLPQVIWMQLGVRDDAAAAKAEARGITVIMNRCPKIEYARLCGEIGWAGVSSRVVSSKKPVLAKGIQRFGIRSQIPGGRK